MAAIRGLLGKLKGGIGNVLKLVGLGTVATKVSGVNDWVVAAAIGAVLVLLIGGRR